MSETFIDAAAVRHRDALLPHVVGAPDIIGDSLISHDHLELRNVPDAGRGWVALNDLPAGTKLWNEAPLSYAATRDGLVRKVDALLWKHEGLCRKRHATSRGAGIVASNYFDFGVYGAYIFEQTSLLNHSCCPNASVRVAFGEHAASGTRMCAKAARRVAIGEQLCISYSTKALFLPTPARRELLQAKWGFWCRCARCELILPDAERDNWVLLEEAAAAADAVGKPASPAAVDSGLVALQRRAAGLLAGWLPDLVEGERFSEDADYYDGIAES